MVLHEVFDAQDAAAPVEVCSFAIANALDAPPPVGDYSMHNVVVRENSAYTSWYSDGNPADRHEPVCRAEGSLVPPAAADLFGILPTAAEMWGVYVQGGLILGSDMNSGLRVLKAKP